MCVWLYSFTAGLAEAMRAALLDVRWVHSSYGHMQFIENTTITFAPTSCVLLDFAPGFHMIPNHLYRLRVDTSRSFRPLFFADG